MCVHVLPACLCTTYMPDANGSQKRALDLLVLKFQMVVSWHVGARELNPGHLVGQPVV